MNKTCNTKTYKINKNINKLMSVEVTKGAFQKHTAMNKIRFLND
jgi:hypothetical protein